MPSNLKSVQEEVELDLDNACDSTVNLVETKQSKDLKQETHSGDTNVPLVNSFDATIGLRLLLNPGLQSPSKLLCSRIKHM